MPSIPSITSWLRLESRSREDDIQVGLQAKVHDPLWMLGRQWQFNEFQGQDSGSPVAAKLEAEAMELTRCFLGPLPTRESQPVGRSTRRRSRSRTMVEREPYAQSGPVDLRFAVDAGRQFVHVLESVGAPPQHAAAYLSQFPLQPTLDGLDAESARFARSLSGRVIDSARLYAALRVSLRPPQGSPALPAAPAIPPADQDRVIAAAQSWLAWYESIVSEPAGAFASWAPNRMEYSFAVAAASPQGEVVLEAPDYREGTIDWFSFGVRRSLSLGAAAGEARVESVSRNVIPAPASYPGMPAERWWEMEDSQIDFGSVRTLPGDLTGLVLLQFAVTYGNDWFVIPADLKVGSLVRIRAVTVTDGFGVATAVPPFSQTAAADGWRMFTLSSTPANEPDLFFLPPSLPSNLTSPPLETVLLTRDEMATWPGQSRNRSRTRPAEPSTAPTRWKRRPRPSTGAR